MLIIYKDEAGKTWHIEPKSGDLYLLREMCKRLMAGKDNLCNPAKIVGPFTEKPETTKAGGVPGPD